MFSRVKIKELLANYTLGDTVTVMGWVRTFRNNQFIALNDGSVLTNLQIVVDFENMDAELLKKNKKNKGMRYCIYFIAGLTEKSWSLVL